MSLEILFVNGGGGYVATRFTTKETTYNTKNKEICDAADVIIPTFKATIAKDTGLFAVHSILVEGKTNYQLEWYGRGDEVVATCDSVDKLYIEVIEQLKLYCLQEQLASCFDDLPKYNSSRQYIRTLLTPGEKTSLLANNTHLVQQQQDTIKKLERIFKYANITPDDFRTRVMTN